MVKTLRLLMGLAAVSLLVAAALHPGLIIPGPFDTAAQYETGVAVILLIGIGVTFVGGSTARWGALASLVLALGGATIGLYLAILGLAPNTGLDIVYHVVLVALLVASIVVAWRLDSEAAPSRMS